MLFAEESGGESRRHKFSKALLQNLKATAHSPERSKELYPRAKRKRAARNELQKRGQKADRKRAVGKDVWPGKRATIGSDRLTTADRRSVVVRRARKQV